MTSLLRTFAIPVLDIASAVLFIMGLKLMGRARSARRGATLLGLGFVVALVGTAVEAADLDPKLALAGLALGIGIGLLAGYGAKIGSSVGWGPALAAAGGVAAALVALAAFFGVEAWPIGGALALQGGLRGAALGLAVVSGAAALGLGLFAGFGPAAGGSGQPAGTALAASASGLASAMLGVALGNPIVATVGALVATAGFSLAAIVGKALGRAPLDIVGGTGRKGDGDGYANVKACGPEETAMVLETARKVVMVPGYGMAVAQAQHALADVAKLLRSRGADVVYAIHPAAGLIPGHMNILLDEAKVDPADLRAWEAANQELADADVALVVGANDIVNPAAKDDPQSAVFGMPFLDVGRARTVFVVKRSLRPGAAAVKNQLFERANTNMVFGDAKKVLQAIGLELKTQMKAAA